jgi:putative acetyltransferase
MKKASSAVTPSFATTPAFRLAPRGEDLEPLADLWIASWRAVMPQIDFAARREWFFAYVKEIEAQGGMTICAFGGDRLVGFMLLDGGRGVLEQIAVRPQLFGSGLAVLLLGEAKRRCSTGLSLEVNVDNARALRFYEKAGFMRLEQGVNPLSGLRIWQMHWLGQSG